MSLRSTHTGTHLFWWLTPTGCRDFPSDALPYRGALHPMDCTDIVLGSVREGNLARIGDYYTRDRYNEERQKVVFFFFCLLAQFPNQYCHLAILQINIAIKKKPRSWVVLFFFFLPGWVFLVMGAA